MPSLIPHSTCNILPEERSTCARTIFWSKKYTIGTVSILYVITLDTDFLFKLEIRVCV